MSNNAFQSSSKLATANPVQHYDAHGLQFDDETKLVAVAPTSYSELIQQDFILQIQQYAVSGDIPFTTILNSLYRKSKEISQMQKRQNSALSAITDATYQKEIIGLTDPNQLILKITQQHDSIFIRRKCHIGGLEDEHTQLSLDVTVIEQIINFLNDKIFPLMSKIFTDEKMDSTDTLRTAQLDLFLGLITNSKSLILRKSHKAPPQNITLARTSSQHCGIMKLRMKIEKLTKQLENTTKDTKLHEAIASQIASLQEVVFARSSTIKADINRQSANILRKNAMRVQKMETKQAVKSSNKATSFLAQNITNNAKMNAQNTSPSDDNFSGKKRPNEREEGDKDDDKTVDLENQADTDNTMTDLN